MIPSIRSIIDLKGKCQSVIKWRLTDACNYKCSYCLRYSWSNKTQDTSLVQQDNELAIRLIPEIARIINEMPGKVKLDLIGGEVSLLDLETILNGIFAITSDKLFRLNITTNMFKPAEYYTNLCDLVYKNGNVINEIKNGNGKIREFDIDGEYLKFEGTLNGLCFIQIYSSDKCFSFSFSKTNSAVNI